MREKKNKSIRIALGGVLGGLSLVLMLSGSIFPFATFLAPALSGILLLPIAIEFGAATGFVLYAAIALLSIFMVPDKEMALIFIFFLGYYPLLKHKLDSLRAKILRWVTKLAVFNGSVFAMYGVILFLFPIVALTDEIKSMGALFLAVLLLAGNVTFVIYDIALVRFESMYHNVWRPRLMKFH